MVVVVVVVEVEVDVVVVDVVELVGGGPLLTLSWTSEPFLASDAPGGAWSNTIPGSMVGLTWFTVDARKPACSRARWAASTG